MVAPKQVRTYIYCINAEKMCYYFELKHAETAQHWVNNSVEVPALLVDATFEVSCWDG
jgi:hypothetical protein